MHDGMPYGRNQGQGQGHSREVDRQSPTGLILSLVLSSCFCSFALHTWSGVLENDVLTWNVVIAACLFAVITLSAFV